VRTEGEPRGVLAAFTAVVRGLDPGIPLSRIRTLTEHAGIDIGQERMIASLLAVFAVLALGLAAVGLYGVIAYTTQVRTREFGIRLALGALPADLLRSVLAQGAQLALAGLTLGLIVAAGASRLLSTLLFGVSPTDRPTFATIAVLLLVVALAASAAPARRAAKVDPISILK
jgi:ABC-type antimicrobial peptide transport system permease subunit